MSRSLFDETDPAYHFFTSPVGKYVLAWELEWYDQFIANIFGYNAVQIGMTQTPFLRKNRILNRWRVGRYLPAEVIADPLFLPLESESQDLIILPHQLEFSPNPEQMLHEVERILAPEGKLFISGFNPLSLWGGYQKWMRFKTKAFAYPWNGNYVDIPQLKEWLNTLHLEPRGGKYGCYLPPFKKENIPDRYSWVESMGDRWWPTMGAVYMVCAVKKVAGMRIIPAPWRNKPASSKDAVPAVSAQKTYNND